MSEQKCYSSLDGCINCHQVPVEQIGRTVKDGANLFFSIATGDLCVRNKDDIARIKKLGFNKFILLTNWSEDELQLRDYGLSNSEILLEISWDSVRDREKFKNELKRWVANGYAGGTGGDFYAVFLDEPHNYANLLSQEQRDILTNGKAERNTYIGLLLTKELADIIHQQKQKTAIGEYSVYTALATTDYLFGTGMPVTATYDESAFADIYLYTGYDGPWYGTGPESNQISYWERLAKMRGQKPAYPFIKLSHTNSSGGIESITDVDYLDTYFKAAKRIFNGAAVYSAEIINEVILRIKEACHKAWIEGAPAVVSGLLDLFLPANELYSLYPINPRLLRMDVGEPELKELFSNEGMRNYLVRCVCLKQYDAYNEYFVKRTNECPEQFTNTLNTALCSIFWRRMELASAAAERQGLLEPVYRYEEIKYYCAKGQCAKCAGTTPFSHPELWLDEPLPMCPVHPPRWVGGWSPL